ncbi:hypothetical protein V6X73_09395 [Spiribacter sp. 390]|uniref:Uncharacterized protein n=1 Tax=Spiribacter pallidus TaxID=1987936 RepID=A0ABV3TGQ1_9GAMM
MKWFDKWYWKDEFDNTPCWGAGFGLVDLTDRWLLQGDITRGDFGYKKQYNILIDVGTAGVGFILSLASYTISFGIGERK